MDVWGSTGETCTVPGVYVSWDDATITEHGVKFKNVRIMNGGEGFPQTTHGMDTKWERVPTYTCIDVSGKSDLERRLLKS